MIFQQNALSLFSTVKTGFFSCRFLFHKFFILFFTFNSRFFTIFKQGFFIQQLKQFPDKVFPLPQREKIQCYSTQNACFNNSTASIITIKIKYKKEE